MDYEARIAKVGKALPEHKVDALLITTLTNVRYLTGFSGTNGQVLVSPERATFFTTRVIEHAQATSCRTRTSSSTRTSSPMFSPSTSPAARWESKART